MISVIEKVQKLLALSKSSNANEAMTAAAIANKLIEQHRLSEADLNGDDVIVEDHDPIYHTGRVTQWKKYLAVSLAHHYGCAIYNSYELNKRKYSQFKLFGRQSDIDIAKYMFNWLVVKCQELSDKHAKGKGHVYVSSYCLGFASGVIAKLKESKNEAQDGASSSAITLINSRTDESIKVLKNTIEFNGKDSNTSASKINFSAYATGHKKGKSIQLTTPLSGK